MVDTEEVYKTHDSHGNLIIQPKKGIVFTRIDHDDRFEYINLLDTPAMADAVRQGINGVRNSVFGLALVRHGIEPNFNYYPLPLIYATPEVRDKAAIGRRRPTEAWVRRIRYRIEKAFSEME